MPVNNKGRCFACGKAQLTSNEAGLCKKMLGRSIRSLYCIECLADYLELSVDELLDKVEEFKEQGCVLFR